MVLTDKNSYIVCANLEGFLGSSADFGSGQNTESLIHPARKAPVGLRLGASVLKYVYGHDTETVALPVRVSSVRDGIEIKFSTSLSLLWGDEVTGFEISADGTSFHKATGKIEGDTVTLTSNAVASPMYVRYGYSNIIFELKDGRRLEVEEVTDASSSFVTFTLASGTSVTIKQGDVVRGYTEGNLTNASASPVPTFKLYVGFTSDRS
jgi:hypothetical protein